MAKQHSKVNNGSDMSNIMPSEEEIVKWNLIMASAYLVYEKMEAAGIKPPHQQLRKEALKKDWEAARKDIEEFFKPTNQ